MEKIAAGDIKIGDYFKTRLGQDPSSGGLSITELVKFFLEAAMVIAGIVMLFLLVGGGIAMIAGAGSGDAGSTAKGKQAVTSAIIGFIIILGAFWVVRIIEIIIGCRIVTGGAGQCRTL
jgi:hypothetical protein